MEQEPVERPSTAFGPEGASDRTHGLDIETCYRHPREVTGVHCTRCGRPICTDCMSPAAVGYQCPECVREAVRTSPRRRTRLVVGRPGSVTTALLIANLGVFAVEVILGGSQSLLGGPPIKTLFDMGALYAPAIAQGQYWRLLTAMFLHAGLLHILLNSYALYLFGYLIENAFGRARFLLIYFLSGILASIASFAFGSVQAVGVGASGAIFGLLGAWVAYNFRRRGTAFASANLQSAMFIIALNLFLGFSVGGIDNIAHIGGLVAGAAAGMLAEGFGPRRVRPLIQGAGITALAIAGAALGLWRISGLT